MGESRLTAAAALARFRIGRRGAYLETSGVVAAAANSEILSWLPPRALGRFQGRGRQTS